MRIRRTGWLTLYTVIKQWNKFKRMEHSKTKPDPSEAQFPHLLFSSHLFEVVESYRMLGFLPPRECAVENRQNSLRNSIDCPFNFDCTGVLCCYHLRHHHHHHHQIQCYYCINDYPGKYIESLGKIQFICYDLFKQCQITRETIRIS